MIAGNTKAKIETVNYILSNVLFWATVVMGILAPLFSEARAMFWPALFFTLFFWWGYSLEDKKDEKENHNLGTSPSR